MKRPLSDRLLSLYAWGSALVLVGALGTILGFLIFKGGSSLNLELIFGHTDPMSAITFTRQVFGGLFPAIIGTLLLVVISVGVALPLGLFAGIWLAEYAPLGLKQAFGMVVDILAGIPSVVVGLFGFSVTVFLHNSFNNQIYPCLLISALSLSFLVLPYIIKTTQGALDSLPLSVRLTAPSLGATSLQNILHVLLPASMSDLLAGLVLAIGRCAEDTAVIMLTGVVATAGIPRSVFSSFEALPFFIYYTASEYSDAAELMKGYGAALILLLVCAGLFALAHTIKYVISRRMD